MSEGVIEGERERKKERSSDRKRQIQTDRDSTKGYHSARVAVRE